MDLKERIIIFVGAFGSGKTEIALNYSRLLASQQKKVAIADLDIVSPYFRSRDVIKQLRNQDIEVIAPSDELAQADLPIIVPRVQGAIAQPDLHVVIDVGGDDIGATALGRFSDQLKLLPHELLLVVNTCRPFTKDIAGIKNMLTTIEKSTHLKVTGLVANSNLGSETTIEIIKNGLAIIMAAAKEISIPVMGVGVRKDLISCIGNLTVPLLPITITLLPPWYLKSVITRDRRAVMTMQTTLDNFERKQ